jgi:putative hydrolase of the HAD superfamily
MDKQLAGVGHGGGAGGAEHADELPVTHLFERCFYSSPLGMIKPSAEIFEHVLAECALDRSETLFVDDSEKNVRGAERVGISGYIFDGDADALREYIYRVAGGGK